MNQGQLKQIMDLKSVYKKTKILWKKIRNVNVFVGRIKKNGFSEMNLEIYIEVNNIKIYMFDR